MSTSLESLATTGRAGGSLRSYLAPVRHNLAVGARRLWDAYWDNQARRATALMLEALDDRTLKDIGLSRHEIRQAVLGNDAARRRSDDPCCRRTHKL